MTIGGRGSEVDGTEPLGQFVLIIWIFLCVFVFKEILHSLFRNKIFVPKSLTIKTGFIPTRKSYSLALGSLESFSQQLRGKNSEVHEHSKDKTPPFIQIFKIASKRKNKPESIACPLE